MFEVRAMILIYLLIGVVGLVLSVWAFVNTPDLDRRFAYPGDPDAWFGATGKPSFTVGRALSSLLFWTVAAMVYGFVAAALGSFLPQHVAFLTGLGAGLVAAFVVAYRLLQRGPGAMTPMPTFQKRPTTPGRPRVLFVGGSPNQTTQMHAIAKEMPEVEAWFSPFYGDHWTVHLVRKLGLVESAILGYRRRNICAEYLHANGLPIDLNGEQNEYNLFLMPNDQAPPVGMGDTPMVLVQEGIQDPPNWKTFLWKYTHLIPRPATGTSTFGFSDKYTKFCVASYGYRDHYLEHGIDPEKLEVTGIPNFDDFARFLDNDFPHRDFVLVCTTDARETGAEGDRTKFLEWVLEIAGDRPLIFKLHPNENFDRAIREVSAVAPHAKVYTSGSAEEMVANCAELICEWSSLTFCGVALGKKVHSYHPPEKLRHLMPLQNRRAAKNIAEVCRYVLEQAHAPAGEAYPARSPSSESRLA